MPKYKEKNKRSNILDAKRYRWLREKAFRSHTGKGVDKMYNIQLHFIAPQNDNWPVQHAFCDLDSAIDETMLK